MSGTPEEAGNGTSGFQGLDPGSVSHGRAVGAVVTVVFGVAQMMAVMIVILAVDELGRVWRPMLPCLVLVTTAASGWIAWKWPAVAHRHVSYRVNEGGLEIRRGVWWRNVIHVPRSRIQHTDVSQGPIERNFGLATLHVFTAGTENAEVALDGLAHDTAMTIRDHLLTGSDDDVV